MRPNLLKMLRFLFVVFCGKTKKMLELKTGGFFITIQIDFILFEVSRY